MGVSTLNGGKVNQNKDGENDGTELPENPSIGHPCTTAKMAAIVTSVGKCSVMIWYIC